MPEVGTSDTGTAVALPRLTQRLILRAHELSDLEDLCRFHSDPDVVRYVPWPVRNRAATEQALLVKIGQAEAFEPGHWLVLAVEERASSRVIGEVLLKWTSEVDRQGEIGFAFAADAQGQGFAAEAASEVLGMGFEEFGLHRITAMCIEENAASARLLDRLGFEQQGRFVDSAWFKDRWASQLMFAMVEDQWRAHDKQSRADAERPRTSDDDVRDVLAAVETFFAAFTSGPDADARLAALRALLLKEALIVRTCGTTPAVYDVDGFIEPRRAMLTDGSLVDFSEWATHGRVEVFGDIAHWFGAYAKSGTFHDAPYGGAGMKSMQFIRTSDGWRVTAAVWDDERPGLTTADHTVRTVQAWTVPGSLDTGLHYEPAAGHDAHAVARSARR